LVCGGYSCQSVGPGFRPPVSGRGGDRTATEPRHPDRERRRQGDTKPAHSLSPCLPVSVSVRPIAPILSPRHHPDPDRRIAACVSLLWLRLANTTVLCEVGGTVAGGPKW